MRSLWAIAMGFICLGLGLGFGLALVFPGKKFPLLLYVSMSLAAIGAVLLLSFVVWVSFYVLRRKE
jgi:hypothetical protein